MLRLLMYSFHTNHYKGDWPSTYTYWGVTKYLRKYIEDVDSSSGCQYPFRTLVSLIDTSILTDT